jgi:hypothetical protein
MHGTPHRILRRWWIGFSCALLLLSNAAYACFPSPLEYQEYKVNLFRPYLSFLHPFHGLYHSYYNMYDVDNVDGMEVDHQLNVNEWYKYMNGKADKKDIYDVLYSTDPLVFSATATNLQVNPQLAANTFYKQLQLPANKKAMHYMLYAKQVEQSQSWTEEDPWEATDYIADRDLELNENEGLEAELKGDNFLLLRYYFQVLKTSYMIPGMEDFYSNKFLAVPVNSVVKNWGAYYYALNVCMHGDKIQGNFLLAKAFSLSAEKKAASYRHYETAKTKEVLKFAKTAKDRADVYALSAIETYGPCLSDIKRLYANNPKHNAFEFVLLREINKVEDWILTPRYTQLDASVGRWYWDEKPPINGKAYLDSLAAFVQLCADEGKVKNKAFINAALAHLYWMSGNRELAAKYIHTAEVLNGNNKELKPQLNLTQILIAAADTITVKQENSFARQIQEIEKGLDYLHEQHTAISQLALALSYNYKKQGQPVRAALCRLKYNWYETYPNIPIAIYYDIDSSIYTYLQENASGYTAERLYYCMAQPNKSAFEKVMTAGMELKGNRMWQVLDVAGSNYLRDGQYANALKMFEKIPASYWNTGPYAERYSYYLNENPFKAKLFSNHGKNEINKGKKYNKYTFCKELVGLKKEVDEHPKDAALLIKYANALYNTTFFGNSWVAVRNAWSRFDYAFYQGEDYYREWGNGVSPRYLAFYNCSKPRTYYSLAFGAAADDEEKAFCLMMMAQCDKNNFYFLNRRKEVGFSGKNYFARLTKNYAHTKFYENLTGLCDIEDVRGYFCQFIP